MIKRLFSALVLWGQAASLLWAGWSLYIGQGVLAAGLLLIAGGPCVQALTGWDQRVVPHHKVRLPVISLVVFVGLALMLLTGSTSSSLLWLGLLNIGGFLLDTYWAREDVGRERRTAGSSD